MKELDRAIYDKYIAPTEKKRELSIGVEIEMPVVNLSGEPVEVKTVLAVSEVFRSFFGFDVQGRDDDGNVNSISDKASGDNLSFDCCYSNLELSMGIGKDLKDKFIGISVRHQDSRHAHILLYRLMPQGIPHPHLL